MTSRSSGLQRARPWPTRPTPSVSRASARVSRSSSQSDISTGQLSTVAMITHLFPAEAVASRLVTLLTFSDRCQAGAYQGPWPSGGPSRWLSRASRFRGGLAVAGGDQVAEPPVFLGVDLSPGEPPREDAARLAAFIAARRPAGAGGDQGVNRPDQQAPEHQHPDPHQTDLPERPVPAVPDHHRDHSSRTRASPVRHPWSVAVPMGGRAIGPARK